MLEKQVEEEWDLWVPIAYGLMSVRDVFGPQIATMLRRHGKNPDAAEWQHYIPAHLHHMAWLAYVRRNRLEAEEMERLRREHQVS